MAQKKASTGSGRRKRGDPQGMPGGPTAWVPNQPLFGTFSLISPAVVGEVETSLAELNASRAV